MYEENDALTEVAIALAKVLVGLGMLGLLMKYLALPVVEFLFILVIPIMGIVVGCGLISEGTVQGFVAGLREMNLTTRVKEAYDDIKSGETAPAA